MKTRLIVLNSLLTAGVFSVVWEARMQLNYAEQTRRTHLENRIKPVAPPPIAPVQKPQTPSALRYEDVAKKDLFAADRNDDIIVDPPKVEAPKVMPPLPVVYGVMTLPSGTRASMAEKAGESSRMVHVGDEVGEFKIVALDARNVTFEWDGKELPHKIEDLIDRSNHQPAPAGQNQAASAAATPAAPPPPPPAQVNNHPTAANLGTELTASSRACQPGDTSPNGSVVDGYKKVMTQSIFGPVCRWVKQ